MTECAKMICHGQHTYVYAQVLLSVLSYENKGGHIVKRLQEEIQKEAQTSNHDVTPITMVNKIHNIVLTMPSRLSYEY